MPFPIPTERGWRTIGVAVCLVTAAGLSIASAPLQQPNVSITPGKRLNALPAPRRSIRLDVNMVLIPVTVSDAQDHPVGNLTAESFRVLEDDVEQKIVSCTREEGPVSMGFVFDTSSSMRGRMERAIEAVRQFLGTAVAGDEFLLIRFSDRPRMVTEFTRDPSAIVDALSLIQPGGWTALQDAICLGVHRLDASQNPRRALLVLTDGGDNNSRYSEREVRNLVRESDVRVYSIGLFTRPGLLEKLAAESGGRAFSVRRNEELTPTIDRLSQEFRSHYLLAYSSANDTGDGKYRKVQVQLVDKAVHTGWNISWRRGYVAPTR